MAAPDQQLEAEIDHSLLLNLCSQACKGEPLVEPCFVDGCNRRQLVKAKIDQGLLLELWSLSHCEQEHRCRRCDGSGNVHTKILLVANQVEHGRHAN